MTTEETELTFVRCPTCRSLVPAVAARCRMCGHQFDAAESDESPDDPGSKKSRVRQRTISASKSEVDGMTERPADAAIRQSEARATPTESGRSDGETPWLVPRAPREAEAARPAFQGAPAGEPVEGTVERERRPSGRVPLRFGADVAPPVRAERWSVQPEADVAVIEGTQAEEPDVEDTTDFSEEDTIISEPESHEDLEPLAVDEENDFDDEGQDFGSAEEQGEELPLGPKKRRRRRRRRRGTTASLESDSMEHREVPGGSELEATEFSEEEPSELEMNSTNQPEYHRSERQETMNTQRQAPPFNAVPAQATETAPIGFAPQAAQIGPARQSTPEGQSRPEVAPFVAQQGGTPHRNDVGRGREGNRAPQEPARRGGGPRVEEEGALVGWFVHFTQDPKGTSSELRSGKFFLGRQRLRDGDMVIGDSAISTPHCLVYASPEEGVRIQDLMSEHGTSVKRVGTNSFVPIQDSVALEHGDVLRLGTYEVLVCLVPNR